MLRQMRVAAVLVAVVMCVGPAFAQEDNLIVPGERISGILLGSSFKEGISAAIAAFGGAPSRAYRCKNEEEDRKAGLQCIVRGWDRPDDTLTLVAFIGPVGHERTFAVATSRKEHTTVVGLGRGSLDRGGSGHGGRFRLA